ncbi:MAG TPA: MarR family transcriptional regulator [Solirubrobacterales bacterium]
MQEAVEGYRAMQLGSELFDDAAAEILGINRTDMRAMDVLQRRGPMTAGALAEEIRLSRPATTTVLDRLERIGYIRRTSDPEDRRRVLAELTPLAFERSMEIWGGYFDFAEREAGRYTVEDLEALRRFAQRGIEENARQIRRLERILAERPGRGA